MFHVFHLVSNKMIGPIAVQCPPNSGLPKRIRVALFDKKMAIVNTLEIF